ncbi:MAG TPA: alanine racemase [Burkholderiales bacterium]|jgi:alanine racemase
MTRPILASIRISALRSNLALARRRAPDARVLAVIKADAYGHGLLRAAHAFADAEGFAVLELDDAVRLRAAGFDRRILMLEGFFDAAELPVLAEERLSCVLHNDEQLTMLQAARLPAAVDVFVKIDTGMNRLGFRPEALRRVLDALRACRNAGEVTLMTHFACADDARGIDWQLDAFRHATTGLALPLSLANSATLLRYPHAASGWARLGIMLYGASPFAEESAHALGLRPAMTLASRIIAVRELAAGESVGYGALFHAREAMRIGVVACGYADGYPRHAPTGTPVLVAGERTRLIGRVSMDMLCVDLSGLPQAQVGASVVLWGEGLPVEEVAQAAGTVSYELLCALAPRVPVVEIE